MKCITGEINKPVMSKCEWCIFKKEKDMPKSRHHILPKSRGGGNDKNNVMITTHKKHTAFNILFGSNALPEEAVMILIKEWFYKEPDLCDRKLHSLVMELSKLLSSYIDEQKRAGLRAGAGV